MHCTIDMAFKCISLPNTYTDLLAKPSHLMLENVTNLLKLSTYNTYIHYFSENPFRIIKYCNSFYTYILPALAKVNSILDCSPINNSAKDAYLFVVAYIVAYLFVVGNL